MAHNALIYDCIGLVSLYGSLQLWARDICSPPVKYIYIWQPYEDIHVQFNIHNPYKS